MRNHYSGFRVSIRRENCDVTTDKSILMWSQWFVCICVFNWNTTEELDHTVFRVFIFSNASIRGGSLVVVLWQGQGPDAWARRRLAAGGLGFLQATVIIAVLGGILQVLHGIGSGESHSPMAVLENKQKKQTRGDNKWNSLVYENFFISAIYNF